MRQVTGSGGAKILGIDENGYGPLLGPLVITGVLFDGREDPKSEIFRDSKKIFQSRQIASYRKLEELALRILSSSRDKNAFFSKLLPPYWLDILPCVSPGEGVLRVENFLYSPKELNRFFKRGLKKSELNFRGFWSIIERVAEDGLTVYAGKIGGTVYKYRDWLAPLADDLSVEREEKSCSSYRVMLGKKRLLVHFVENAEECHRSVAMASIVGKYIREILMLEVCRELGYGGKIPYCSGYHADPRTKVLARKIKAEALEITRYIRQM
ncbi:MAG TPA: hypothetical protein VJC03_00880 [bacterium]|nr:hypothetical protein [bacterium]